MKPFMVSMSLHMKTLVLRMRLRHSTRLSRSTRFGFASPASRASPATINVTAHGKH